jgi:hypothetical protein
MRCRLATPQVAHSLPLFEHPQGATTMHKTPNPSDPSTPIEEPPQTPDHVPELPPIRDPDPQQEQS